MNAQSELSKRRWQTRNQAFRPPESVRSRNTSQSVLPLVEFMVIKSPWCSNRRWSFSSGHAPSPEMSASMELVTLIGLRSLRFLTWNTKAPAPERATSLASICRCWRDNPWNASSMSNRCQKSHWYERPRTSGIQASPATRGPCTMRRWAATAPSRRAVPPTSRAKKGPPTNSMLPSAETAAVAVSAAAAGICLPDTRAV
mmetsp:Transcript_75779/g.149804  ORF Transcript_75779/g.149804 Transcript_75779/m.149804 type:complete len:200 (-) Transcript_75779:719-1318(-)